MKPLSELVKELHTDRTHAFNQYGENPESYKAFDAGMFHAAGLLQAWLREADKRARQHGYSRDSVVRWNILGTTRPPREEE